MKPDTGASPGGPLHLTYCLNVHPGETWEENLHTIRTDVLEVRDRVAPGLPFGLGMRLSHGAAASLSQPAVLADFKRVLDDHGLYVFTVNGFPYGDFHGTRVKENVYRPDWRTQERLEYTLQLARILATLLPEDVPGSISTVPGSYKRWVRSAEDRGAVIRNLARCARHLAELEHDTGRTVALALEPEPDCMIETTPETIHFFSEELPAHPELQGGEWRRHLGVCLDTCHLAVRFEDPAQSLHRLREKRIAVPKVQLSAALSVMPNREASTRLAAFAEHTYLHQVSIRAGDGSIRRFPDLTDEVLDAAGKAHGGEARVHFHVPLYWTGTDGLLSTGRDLDARFFDAVREAAVPHLEIETYTFGVLPGELASLSLTESIAREFEWVLERL